MELKYVIPACNWMAVNMIFAINLNVLHGMSHVETFEVGSAVWNSLCHIKSQPVIGWHDMGR